MRRATWLGAGAFTAFTVLAFTLAPDGSSRLPVGAAEDGARVVGEFRRSRRILDLTISSPVLDGDQHVRLLLPPDWSPTAARTWPTLWLLHGGLSDHTAWTSRTAVERLTEGLGVIVVMPDGGRCGNYTDWWNQGEGGGPQWETFHLTELREILERGYRAGRGRAIAGNSMGGVGAIAYAARHRGMFRAAASFSGHLDTLYESPSRLDALDVHQLVTRIGRPGTDWRQVWGHPHVQRPIWRQHNPCDLAPQLSGVRLYVSSGTGRRGPLDAADTPDVLEELAHTAGTLFTGKLKKIGVPVTSHFYDGTHGWPYWEQELRAALPLLLDGLL